VENAKQSVMAKAAPQAASGAVCLEKFPINFVMLCLRGGSTEGLPMTSRRFPAPWQVEQIPGGYKVLDATGQALAYV
jgi:hypothetical protein